VQRNILAGFQPHSPPTSFRKSLPRFTSQAPIGLPLASQTKLSSGPAPQRERVGHARHILHHQHLPSHQTPTPYASELWMHCGVNPRCHITGIPALRILSMLSGASKLHSSVTIDAPVSFIIITADANACFESSLSVPIVRIQVRDTLSLCRMAGKVLGNS